MADAKGMVGAGAEAGGTMANAAGAPATATVTGGAGAGASPSSSKGSTSLTAASQQGLTLTALRKHTASHDGKPLGLAEKVRGMAAGKGEDEAASPPEADDSRRRRSRRKQLSDEEFLGKVMYAVSDQLSTRKSMIRYVRKLIQDRAYRHWCVASPCCLVFASLISPF